MYLGTLSSGGVGRGGAREIVRRPKRTNDIFANMKCLNEKFKGSQKNETQNEV